MARIELRNCDVIFQDGLTGTAVCNMNANSLIPTTVLLDIETIALNTTDTDKVPLGARLTIGGETADTVHTVTARTPTSGGPTLSFTISPAVGAGTYLGTEPILFLPQQLDIKTGDGNVTYTEHKTYEYLLDRGDLDTVREGNQVPMDVKLECVYEHITQGTSEVISPMDALKDTGGAAEWVSSSADPCEPYSIDVIILHTPPCGTSENEQTTFPDFRSDTKEIDFQKATIAVTGKCNVVEPLVDRDVD